MSYTTFCNLKYIAIPGSLVDSLTSHAINSRGSCGKWVQGVSGKYVKIHQSQII